MKGTASTTNGRAKTAPAAIRGPRMTRQLAEKRAVGNPKALKFDGAAFLRTLKK